MNFFLAAVWALLIAFIFYLLNKLVHFIDDVTSHASEKIHIDPHANGHHWVIVSAMEPGNYCNACEMAVFQGAICDYCGMVSHRTCARKIDKTLGCKDLASNDEVSGVTIAEQTSDQGDISEVNDNTGSSRLPAKIGMASTSDPTEDADNHKSHTLHHWVKGNLPCGSVCCVCNEHCGDGPGLVDLRCVWCQTVVHERKCYQQLSKVCSLGRARRFIVPPVCVRLKMLSTRLRRRSHVIEKIVPPTNVTDWRPVLIAANAKSGNGEGDLVLQAFRRILNPAQVLDLNRVPPETGLRWCTLMPSNIRVRIIISGGDGTVQWVLSAIEKLKLNLSPEIGLIPLGTGNDLARVLGWGSGHTGPIDALKLLESISHSVPVEVDRWAVKINPRRRFGMLQRDRELRMSNYFSIGVDACVTLNFHNRREALPRTLSSRFINKLLFFHYGTKDVLERQCKDLTSCLQLYLDDEPVQLPCLEGICILNIPSWGGGVRPWSMITEKKNTKQQKTDDNLIEVFGLYSSFHIAQLQVGLSEPYCIGQASNVTLRIFQRHVPMQCDGEPWRQSPATITIRRSTEYPQATMLATFEAAHELNTSNNT